MHKFVLAVLFAGFVVSSAGAQTVTLLHVSDYHSQALPFYGERGPGQGGIARAIQYLRREKSRGALVFSGGDTINKGAPAWSDKFGCVEWPWLNGILDAMAFGNHDADYGLPAFERCRASVTYPILSANTNGMKRYAVLESKGKRIGVFAIAGPDFPRLVRIEGLTFGDPVAAAKEVVRELREKEQVDAIVMIGHQHAEDDYALARAVPGITLIFGSHSHLERDLTLIPGTSTWFISPFQYLTYISRVELTFVRDSISVRGRLVPVDGRMDEDRVIARKVRAMQRELESESPSLFASIGKLTAPLKTAELAKKSLEIARAVASADVAVSTVSSYRRPLPQGTITMELLRAAMPYDNEIVVCTMKAADWQRVLEENERRKGSDSELFIDGDRRSDSIRVAATDYVANVAYREQFRGCEKTGKKVRAELIGSLFR
jgi:5'-nucleotidase / UDP-sugar diphosphatase